MADRHDIHPGPQQPREVFRDAKAEIAREMKRRLDLCPDEDQACRDAAKAAASKLR